MANIALASGQTNPVAPYRQHVVAWCDVWRNAVIVNGPRIFVPQAIYEPHSQGDKERYVSLATLHPPIFFFAQGSSDWGIPLQDLLSKQLVQLVDGNVPAFTSCGPSVGIRVQVCRSLWPRLCMIDSPAVARVPIVPQTDRDERLHSPASHDQ